MPFEILRQASALRRYSLPVALSRWVFRIFSPRDLVQVGFSNLFSGEGTRICANLQSEAILSNEGENLVKFMVFFFSVEEEVGGRNDFFIHVPAMTIDDQVYFWHH